MRRARLARLFWIGAAAALVAAALVALAAVVRGEFSDTDGRILGTLAALLFAGSALLAGLALVERGIARPLGWALIVAAPVSLAFVLRAVWTFADEGGGDEWKPGWSGILVLIGGLVAATALLLVRRQALVRVAAAAGVLAVLAAAVSIAAIWMRNPGDTIAKTLAGLWILAALAYFLVPILQRWSAVGERNVGVRVLAALGDVELVASREHIEGVVVDARQAAGERLVLRHRQAGTNEQAGSSASGSPDKA